MGTDSSLILVHAGVNITLINIFLPSNSQLVTVLSAALVGMIYESLGSHNVMMAEPRYTVVRRAGAGGYNV